MRTVRGILLAAALVAGIGACGEDATAPSPETLAGTWVATKAELVSVANPSLKIDLVALGGSVHLVLTASKAFTLTVTPPGEPEEQGIGTWSTEEDELNLNFSSGAMHGDMNFQVNLSGTTLTLTGANWMYNIDGAGGDDEVHVNLTMTRQ